MASNNKGSGYSGSAGSSGNGSNCDCGYDPSNKRHEQSYWEGLTDPRDKPDSHMKYNSHYYRLIDRQIAEDHATECIPQGRARASGSTGQQQSQQKK